MRGEIGRRLVHASGSLIPVLYLVELVSWTQLRFMYVGGLIVVFLLEIIRLRGGIKSETYQRFYGMLIREYEQSNLAGYVLYMVGTTIVVLWFSPRVAVPAVLIVSLADPVSGMLGENDSSTMKRPTVLGVTFLISVGIAVVFVPLAVAVLAGLVAALADGAKPVIAGYVIDDNVTIPVGAALTIWLGLRYLPVIGII